jgi:hypothetical protein
MYTPARDFVLKWLRVPAEPHPPAGDPASLRIFRAGKRFFNLRLLTWGFAQVAALVGIVFWVLVFLYVENGVRTQREARAAAPASAPVASPTSAATPTTASAAEAQPVTESSPVTKTKDKAAKRRRSGPGGWEGFKQTMIGIGLLIPSWCFPLLWALKIVGFLFYLAQIPITYAVRRLDYEMRWYIVTDRSLRIRTGVWRVQELTMSFANLQQVEVSQGPLQNLLGLADVRVQSAGGGSGGSSAHGKGTGDSLHTAMFHSVDNANEIRDLILERLRRFRAAGLGDPDDHHEQVVAPLAIQTGPAGHHAETLAAARDLLAEARELRRALAGS